MPQTGRCGLELQSCPSMTGLPIKQLADWQGPCMHSEMRGSECQIRTGCKAARQRTLNAQVQQPYPKRSTCVSQGLAAKPNVDKWKLNVLCRTSLAILLAGLAYAAAPTTRQLTPGNRARVKVYRRQGWEASPRSFGFPSVHVSETSASCRV